MREVFLSHSSRDHAKARRLKKVLVAHGVPVWFSPHHILGAKQWQDEIGEALLRCDWFIILLTPNAVKSMWVKREVEYVLSEKRYVDRIRPLLFKTCEIRRLSWVLPQMQAVDFTKDYWKACDQMLRAWGMSLEKPSRRNPRK